MNNIVGPAAMTDVQEVFEAVVGLPPEHREAWLEQHHGDDQELLNEIRSLLQFHSMEDDPLEQGCHVESSALQQAMLSATAGELPKIVGYDDFTKVADGGQSVVYRARQLSTGQCVAVKFIPNRMLSAASERRLRQETELLADLQHPNIVTVIDQPQSSDGSHCLVTRFIRGLPLNEFAQRIDHDKWDVLATVMLRICSAVDAAHRKGVVHRDLKPSNILVDENHEPYLLDFGLAKNTSDDTDIAASGETLSGTFVGSIPWASPEQVDGSLGPIQAQTDVYQLAIVFYQLLSGDQFPYSVDGGCLGVFQRILNASPAPLTNADFVPTQLSAINRVLAIALHKLPEGRYGSTVEFGEALTAAMRQSRPEVEQPAAPIRSIRFGLWLATLCAVLIVSAVTSWAVFSRNESILTSGASESEAVESVIEVDFARQRAPHLPAGWSGDSIPFVDGGQLTIPKGTRRPAMVRTNELAVERDWLLTIEHEIRGNGQLQVSMLGNGDAPIDITLYRGRIESSQGRQENSSVVGRRTLAIRRDRNRLMVSLQGAEPVHLDASGFGQLSQLQFAMRNDGSGGGEVGIHVVRLQRILAANGET